MHYSIYQIMKFKHYIYIMGAGIVMSLVSSCSTVEGIIGKVGTRQQDHKTQIKKGKTSAIDTSDINMHHPDKVTLDTPDATPHFTEEIRCKVFSRLSGEWTFYSVKGKKITGDERPYIMFDSVTGRFYGTNGCNLLNGDVAIISVEDIRFEEIVTTMMECPDDEYERLINQTLADVEGFVIKTNGHESFLELLDADRRPIIVLRRHDTEFVNGYWAVVKIDGKKIDEEHRPELVIDLPEMKIHGNTSCNIVNGSIYVDPDKNNSIQFQGLGVTRMACPEWSVQTEFLVALESVESVRRVNSKAIELLDEDGKTVLLLHRVGQK